MAKSAKRKTTTTSTKKKTTIKKKIVTKQPTVTKKIVRKNANKTVASKKVASKKVLATKKKITNTTDTKTTTRKKPKTATNKVASIMNLEKTIAQLRKQLMMQVTKEVSMMEKQRDQIKMQLIKAQSREQLAQERYLMLKNTIQAKPTQAFKLRVTKAKQLIALTQRGITTIEKELSMLEKQLDPLLEAKDKISAMREIWDNFESEWAEQQAEKRRIQKEEASKTETPIDTLMTDLKVQQTTDLPETLTTGNGSL